MSFNLIACLTLLSLFRSIPTSSAHITNSISSTLRHPSDFLNSAERSKDGRLRSRIVSSFLERKLTGAYRNRLAFSSEVRLAAETVNSSSSSTQPRSGNGKLSAGASRQNREKEKSLAFKWLAGALLGAIAGAISCVTASELYRCACGFVKCRQASKPMVFQRRFIDANALAFFKRAVATESLELLGRGGSGEVFKATLGNGITVAIKRVFCGFAAPGKVPFVLEMSHDLTRNSAQILAELRTLGCVRHRNLVSLLAYIPQPDAHLLIYEYMEHGSLHNIMKKVKTKTLELPWAKRLEIAQDVATGLKYLHCESDPAIMHRDLTPANILLDKNMVAHIGDFGLAKMLPDELTHITSQHVAGTVGYIAPEYFQSLRYTAKGDMYAFGVVLIVLITGKEPADSFFADVNKTLGNWLADILGIGEEDSVKAIIDPSLHGLGNDDEMILTMKVAYYCLNEDPRKRPNADDVLKMLNQIKQSEKPPLPSVKLLASAM